MHLKLGYGTKNAQTLRLAPTQNKCLIHYKHV